METVNYYGSLCAKMYEILHSAPPQDELAFYLSYAKHGKKILEPMCGSGRFLVPFLNDGYDISGVDLSEEMLQLLRQKAPEAKVVRADFTRFCPNETFDYIFISSGSVSLFTDLKLCKAILRRAKNLLAPGGIFVFAVDTVSARCADDAEYRVNVSVKTAEGFDLILKTKNFYDESSQTQFSPGVYELYDRGTLLKRETMDFQTHLYRFGEMDHFLEEAGFTSFKTYVSFRKDIAANGDCAVFLYECAV